MDKYLFGITDAGKLRDSNEDVFIAQEVMDGQYWIAGVIDGVGGYEGGEIAAALTKEAVLNELSVIGPDVSTQLELAFTLANEEIFARKLGDKTLSKMACVATVAVVDTSSNTLHFIHVGDTRLYLYRDNTLIKLSSDQSPVGFLEDSGRITEQAAMQHPQRNMINHALGLGTPDETSNNYFEKGSSPFLPGDLILVCSDGLTDMINKEVMSRVLSDSSSIQIKAEKLVAEANAAGGKDNITVVIAQHEKSVAVQTPVTPAPDLFTQAPPAPKVDRNPFHAVDQPPTNDIKPYQKESGNKKTLIIGLAILCMVCMASTAWLFFTSPPVKLKDSAELTQVQTVPMTALEKKLTDTLAKLKGDTLKLDTGFITGPVVLTRALQIIQDTLYIQLADPIIFSPDSTFKGPALQLSANTKYVMLEKAIFQNFGTGIVSNRNALELKDVQFINCTQPLQIMFQFPDKSYVTGRVSKRAFQADTLEKK